MSDDKRPDAGQAGGRPEGQSASNAGRLEPTQPAEQPQPQPAQHKGRGGARPGAGRKAKWGEKTVVMRVPVSMRGAVEEFLAGKASAAGQDAQASEPAAAAVQQTGLAEATARWERERASLKAQLEEMRAQLVLAEGQRQALAAEAERLRQGSGSNQAMGCAGPSGLASAATDAVAASDPVSSETLAPNAVSPAGEPAAAAPVAPAPKPKKSRAPRKKKAQDKAGAVDPSRQISLFDLLGDD